MRFIFWIFWLASFGLAFVTRPLFMNLLLESNLLRPNYRGKSIPSGMGLYLFFNLAVLWSFGYLINIYPFQRFFPVLLLAGIFAFLGFVDDLLGNHKARGFIGHFRYLLAGRLTTGGLKALGAATISLVIVYYSTHTLSQAFVSWLNILLITNLINLMDLRPGRALKVFTFLFFLLFLFTWHLSGIWYLAVPVLAVLVFYFPLDFSAIAMMGDTGANLLGGILGFFVIQTVGFWGEGAILFVVILIHLYSERYSISTLIEENRLLAWLDRLGRHRT